MSRRLNRHLNSKTKFFTSVWSGVIPISPFKPVLVRIISYPLSDPVHQKLSIWLNYGSALNFGAEKIIPYFMASLNMLILGLNTHWYIFVPLPCLRLFFGVFEVLHRNKPAKLSKILKTFRTLQRYNQTS